MKVIVDRKALIESLAANQLRLEKEMAKEVEEYQVKFKAWLKAMKVYLEKLQSLYADVTDFKDFEKIQDKIPTKPDYPTAPGSYHDYGPNRARKQKLDQIKSAIKRLELHVDDEIEIKDKEPYLDLI